jgi:hypothetical protein
MPGDQAETALPGGVANAGLVFRHGDTVRRPTRATHEATHALLAHLAAVGFDGAPRFLGVDRLGREILSYVPGEAVTSPYPSWALTNEALISVAQLLRRYHDAVETFSSADHRWPELPPRRFRTGLVSHNDPNLDNVVFRDGRAVALIDFDLASPGSRLWDVAGAARLWAPLRSPQDIQGAVGDSRVADEALGRFRTFVDAYGPLDLDRDLLVDAVLANHNWCYDIVRKGAENGNPGYVRFWTDGGSARSRRARRWFRHSEQVLRSALS